MCSVTIFFSDRLLKISIFLNEKRGAGIVEATPAYDKVVSRLDIRFLKEVFIVLLTEITGIAAADLVHDFFSMLLMPQS